MINVKTILRKKKLSNGKYPICLRVTKDRKSKYFKTLFDATEAEWDSNAGKFNKRNENYIQNNRLLHKFQDRALKVVGELQIEKEDFALEEFEKRYRIDTNPIKTNVFAFWEEIICEMIEAGRTGNARANRDTYNSLKMFNRSTNLTFKQITPTYLNKYEVFLRSRGGTDGGIGVRMRAIRALYNFGISRNIVKSDFYPFKAYKLSRLKGKGAKRALSFDEVQRIVKMDISNYPTLRNTRNFFVFSFYSRGMNFTDMMKLEWNDIKGDRIFYTRSKTKGNFILKVLPPVQEILNYYKENSKGTKYVFPLLLNENMTPIQIENRKSKTLKKFNKDLKEIARLCKIDKNISSYVARHSFANCLKQKGVATDVISESMGHQNLAITQAYLKELDSSVLDEASELLLV